MNRTYLLASLLFIVALSSYLYLDWREQSSTQVNDTEAELIPDFVAESLTSRIYSQQGKLSHSVKAKRMEHFSLLDFTHFEFPYYTLYPEGNGLPWQVSANEAVLYGNNKVVLENRVHLIATDENSPIKEIHCKYLEMDLNTNMITSDQTIIIHGSDFTMYGSGLSVDLNTSTMKLNQHVQTVYKHETN
jgi:lipopolysaccharide export system protein LptC